MSLLRKRDEDLAHSRSKFGHYGNQNRPRELTTGLLSKNASFRLIVSGEIGAKEIDRLIKKLELDKEILAEQDADEREAAN